MAKTSPKNSAKGPTQGFETRNTPRKGKKMIFFEISSGNIVFEYGGVQTPFTIRNSSDEEVEIYELGCLVKEIREENYLPQIVFFFTGDFMDATIKKFQVTMKFAMNFAAIEMKQLF